MRFHQTAEQNKTFQFYCIFHRTTQMHFNVYIRRKRNKGMNAEKRRQMDIDITHCMHWHRLRVDRMVDGWTAVQYNDYRLYKCTKHK